MNDTTTIDARPTVADRVNAADDFRARLGRSLPPSLVRRMSIDVPAMDASRATATRTLETGGGRIVIGVVGRSGRLTVTAYDRRGFETYHAGDLDDAAGPLVLAKAYTAALASLAD